MYDMVEQLLASFSGPQGRDTLGVPLLDLDRIGEIWESQQKHMPCLQDPVEFPMYTKLRTVKKGGYDLLVYRCAGGSTSLESFHRHLVTFVPGNYFSITP